MTESISVAVKSRSGGRIYLDGTACGDTGKYYCITYATTGAGGDIANSQREYTFWLGGCLGIGSSGCYIPDSGDGNYRVYLDEVTKYGCEDKIRWVDTYTLVVETETCSTPTCSLSLLSTDDLTVKMDVDVYPGSGESWLYSNPYIEWGDGNRTYNTTDGIYAHTYAFSGTFNVKLFAINDCYETCTRYKSVVVEEKETYRTIGFFVFDVNSNRVEGAHVKCGAVEGNTNIHGFIEFSITTDACTATCTPPEGYKCSCSTCKCVYNIGAGTSNAMLNFIVGIEETQKYSITCYVKDEQGLGIKDVYVNCFAKNGRTGDDGYIKFSDLDGGNYIVEIIAPDGYTCTNPIGCAHSFALDVNKTINFIIKGTPATCNNGEQRCVWDSSQSRFEIEKCVNGAWTHDSWCPVGATCNNGICGAAPPPPECDGKTKTECDAESSCYWWDSDNACHDTPESTTYPTIKITSDLDAFSGVDAYVDGTKRGVTPITISLTEGDIGKTVVVSGVFAGVMGTRDEDVVLKAGVNEVGLELLMDNKEILAGGTIAGALLINYSM